MASPVPRSGSARRRAALLTASAAVVAVVVGCSSSPDTGALKTKLEQVNGLTSLQATCVVSTMTHTLSAKQLRTVASAQGRGGITDRAITDKLDAAVRSCVVVTSTVPPTAAPGSTVPVVTQQP